MKRVLYILLAMLILCSCRTKEKVTNRLTESAKATVNTVQTQSVNTDSQIQQTTTTQTTQTAWNDSIVEKTYERVVTDSCGRVLQKEVEHTKESHKTRGSSHAVEQQKRQESQEAASQSTTAEEMDSTYNDNKQEKTTTIKRGGLPWLWYVLFFACLVILCLIIFYKIVRR